MPSPELLDTPDEPEPEPQDSAPMAVAHRALVDGHRTVLSLLVRKREARRALNAEIAVLVEEEKQFVQALRPFEKAAAKAAQEGSEGGS